MSDLEARARQTIAILALLSLGGRKEASHTGEIYLFAAAFLPGIIAGWACLVAFGGPMWRALRAG